MSTRSRIGIQLKDDSIRSVYHHWDGYPEWLGIKLKEHYNTRELATKLIRGGDMSSCWTDERWTKKGVTKGHPYGPMYYSRRGEKCPSRKDPHIGEYVDSIGNCGEEYGYLFFRNEWICFSADGKGVVIPEPKSVIVSVPVE